jgi:hypothetical protein
MMAVGMPYERYSPQPLKACVLKPPQVVVGESARRAERQAM